MRRNVWLGLTIGTIATAAFAAQNAAASAADEAKQQRDARSWEALANLYPRGSLARGEEGAVGFKIKIDGEGQPRECQVTHTSGYPLLDRDTCRLVLIYTSGYKRPKGLKRWEAADFEGVFTWKLPTTPRSKVFAPPKELAVAAAPEKLSCRQYVKTGTIAGKEMVCMPPPEWLAAWDETQGFWRDVRKQGFSAGGKPKGD